MRCWIALHTSITTDPGAALMDQAGAQRAVASMALAFTPRVALVDEAVLMDVTGSLRLFGGLQRLMHSLQVQLQEFFESNRCLALVQRAQGATSLIALGRLRMKLESPQGETGSRRRVAELPMHTLSAARPHLGVLERIGCRHWDDLLRLPRGGVVRRFGAELLEALDRARGSLPDDYLWQVLPEHFDERLELDALVEHAPALMAGADRLLARLQAWLLGRQSGLSALRLVWHLDKRRDVPASGELDIRTANPAQDLRHVARLVAEHLAQQELPAPVHALSLQSLATEPLAGAAAATCSLLMDERRSGDSAAELVERLSARLGESQVQAWQPVADHRPERMQRWVSAQSAIKSIAACAGPERARGRKGLKTASPPRTEALYPSWLLPQPLKLAVAGNSPVYQGRLVRLAGPQRMEAGSWLMAGEGRATAHEARVHPPAMRDYFIYRSSQGCLLWIYSERLQRPTPGDRPRHAWYLQGFFA
jgi:protein ImuB